MSLRRARWAPAITVVALGASTLAGCGAGDSPGGSAATLRLGYFPNITHAPALVGVQNGIFADTLGPDVKLETKTFNAGPSAIEALFSEAIDATYIGPNPAINGWAQSKGTALKIIAGTTSGGAALVVRDGIDSVDDLRGKKIATPQLANSQDVALRYWLREHGLKTDQQGGGDVSVLPTPNAETVAAFASGAIDGAWVPEPYASQLILKHQGKVLVDEKDEWPDGQFVTTHLIVRTEFLKDSPELVRRLLQGHIEAVAFTNDHREAAQKAANEHLAALSGKPLPENIIAAAFTNLTFTVDPIAASLQGSAAHAQEVGLLDPVDLKGIYDLGSLNELLSAAGRPLVSPERLAP
jgi:NitT/TauT family transport system substrate-binding protein